MAIHAAQEPHTAQSNVSARIHALEKKLGAPPFRRHARGVALPKVRRGEQLLPYATHQPARRRGGQAIGDETDPFGCAADPFRAAHHTASDARLLRADLSSPYEPALSCACTDLILRVHGFHECSRRRDRKSERPFLRSGQEAVHSGTTSRGFSGLRHGAGTAVPPHRAFARYVR
ncbi:LysR family transcriptional regulator [Streptomyces sp. NPDC052721]|uniref:LysR family transcriptional regulator n=1 Tax=Streptomyces sp. NPDC052721 TaxID=3154955 RepID=UPI0034450CBA